MEQNTTVELPEMLVIDLVWPLQGYTVLQNSPLARSRNRFAAGGNKGKESWEGRNGNRNRTDKEGKGADRALLLNVNVKLIHLGKG